MAIYPDKKNGELTGRFRVELQRGRERYRKRFDSLRAAKADEARITASWAAGEATQAPAPVAAPETHTLASVTTKAKGQLWSGTAGEESAWAHIRIAGEILGADTPLDDIDTLAIDDLVRGLRKRKIADATVNRHLSHLRTFLKWAYGRKYRTVAVKDIEFAWRKESPGRIRWITPEEEVLLEKHLPQDIWWVVKIGIETGCRRGEILSVEPSQINGTRLHLWDTKTDSPRTVPMGPETTRILTELVTNKRMPSWAKLRAAWNKAKVAMGLKDDADFVFHATRHTRATRLLDKGVNVLVIKEWLGHKRIETTQRYTHVKPANLEAALEMVGGY